MEITAQERTSIRRSSSARTSAPSEHPTGVAAVSWAECSFPITENLHSAQLVSAIHRRCHGMMGIVSSTNSSLDHALHSALDRLGPHPLSVVHWRLQWADQPAWRTAIEQVLDPADVVHLALIAPQPLLPGGAMLLWTTGQGVLVRDPAASTPRVLDAAAEDLRENRWKPLIAVDDSRLHGSLVELLTEDDRGALAVWLRAELPLAAPIPDHGDEPAHWHETLSTHEPADVSDDVVDAATAPDSHLAEALESAGLHTAHWWVPELLTELDGHPVRGIVDGSQGLVALTDHHAVCVEVSEREAWLATVPLGSVTMTVEPGEWPTVALNDGDVTVDLGEVDQSAVDTLQEWAAREPRAHARLQPRSALRAGEPAPRVAARPAAPEAPVEAPVELARPDVRDSPAWSDSGLDLERRIKPAVLNEALGHLDEDETVERIIATDDAAVVVLVTQRRLVSIEEKVQVGVFDRPVHDVVLARDGMRRRQVLLVSNDKTHRAHLQRLDRDTAEWLAGWAHSAP